MGNYLPLSKAAEFCDYSQDYLSLRARQGKLRAIKIGRHWFTTKLWLEEYLDSVNIYLSERFSAQISYRNHSVENTEVSVGLSEYSGFKKFFQIFKK